MVCTEVHIRTERDKIPMSFRFQSVTLFVHLAAGEVNSQAAEFMAKAEWIFFSCFENSPVLRFTILLISYEHKENWMCKMSTGIKDAETSMPPIPFFSFKNLSITHLVIPFLRCIVTPLEYSDTLWDLFVCCQCRVQIMSLLKPLHHYF